MLKNSAKINLKKIKKRLKRSVISVYCLGADRKFNVRKLSLVTNSPCRKEYVWVVKVLK